MSLIYDPSAIRYASTQQAYGLTWTLEKIENDGAQVWKNTKGQKAIVPKVQGKLLQQIQNAPTDIPLIDPPYVSEKSKFGSFAGEVYLKRKFYTRPKEGNYSVSQNNIYLYRYTQNEWWIVGKDDLMLDEPKQCCVYFPPRSPTS